MPKFQELRKKYPRFVYEKYFYKISGRNLEIFFDFNVGSDIRFQPKIIVENVNKKRLAEIGDRVLNNLIFHLGLIEIPSYWKATCSPLIEIEAGYLNQGQIKWWKSLFIRGLGQFYYENKINFKKPDLVKITAEPALNNFPPSYQERLKDRYLVPFAGGRDSIVTLEGLKRRKKEISLFTVNPIEKIQRTVAVTGIKKQIIIRRLIDKKLLELNKKGYLNGHTPFTSLLSFLAVFCGILFDYKNVVFSNEKSSNEGNVRYLGGSINHQWAKSSEFEEKFKTYCKKYLAKNLNYFSFIREYGELEISQKLIKFPRYFPVFSSCNAGMRINAKGGLAAKERWCGNCPKCLFVYLTLYPFLKDKDLFKIFGQDIFQNRKLLPVLRGLLGQGSVKPFECVGTKAESKRAFELCLKKAKTKDKIPYLLTKIK